VRHHILLLAAALTLPCAAARADATTETELRAALQQSTAQIATLEDQVANLQAAEAPDTAMIEALKAQVQMLQKSGGAAAPGAGPAKPANDKQLAALRRRVAATAAALDKSQAAYAQEAAAAGAKSAQVTQLSAQLAALNARINTCDKKNAALFRIANQILDAYSHKDDVFGVIANREPFIGFKRVQLQNIVQDDQDALLDNQIAPGQAAP
jgi:chromosome segregation ATPase